MFAVSSKLLHVMWSSVLFVVALCGIMALTSQHVSAETDGYPYATTPCAHAPYAVNGSKAQWCQNYDWGSRRDDTSAANVISPYGYYYRNCTDYAAWRLSSQGVPASQYKGLGHAKNWTSTAAAKGLRVDAVPAAGSVGVRTQGSFGHVAYVETVHGDGTITVAQYNKQATGIFSRQSGSPDALGLSHFVHFETMLPPPAVVAALPAQLDIPEPVSSPVLASSANIESALPIAVPPAAEPLNEAAPESSSLPPKAHEPATLSARPVEPELRPEVAASLPQSVAVEVGAPPPASSPPANKITASPRLAVSSTVPTSLPLPRPLVRIAPGAVPVQWWRDATGSPPAQNYQAATQRFDGPVSPAGHAVLVLLAVLVVWREVNWRAVRMFTDVLLVCRHSKST
jgi:surface antigen